MNPLWQKYKVFFSDKTYLRSFLLSLLMLLAVLVFNFYAGQYATKNISYPVEDIILSNTPAFHIEEIFIYGSELLGFLIILMCFAFPEKMPFTLKSLSLFTLTRSIFINLTHIAPFPIQIPLVQGNIVGLFTFGGDLFFSGHTGLPYLLALIFWEKPRFRYFYIVLSVFFGIIVLLGHLHYTIDVVAAFFITFCIYRLSEIFFKTDLYLSKSLNNIYLVSSKDKIRKEYPA